MSDRDQDQDDLSKRLEKADRKIRIEKLKREVEAVTGEPLIEFGDGTGDDATKEQFWEQVLDWEKAPSTTLFVALVDAGVQMPDPDEMSDEAVTATLQAIVRKFAEWRVYLENTDHLSDRELYVHLLDEVLHDQSKFGTSPTANFHLDLIDIGSEEDAEIWLKYYADEEARQDWARDFPEATIPPREDLPYNRDRFLPHPSYGPLPEAE